MTTTTQITYSVSTIGFLGFIVTICLYWKNIARQLIRWRLKYLPVKKFNVAVSLKCNEGKLSETYNQEVQRRILQEIEKYSLSNIIKIQDIGDYITFNSKDEALAYRKKKNLDLIIWGEFSGDGIKKNGELINEPNIHLAFGHPKGAKGKIGKMIVNELSSIPSTRMYWKIIDSNSLDDIQFIGTNVSIIATYLLGLTTLISGKLDASREIYEKIIPEVKDPVMKRGVIHHLKNIYFIQLLEVAFTHKDYEQGIETAKKLLLISPNDFTAIADLAAFHAKLGQMEIAESYVKKLKAIAPNAPITIVDLAYFSILRGQYSKALNYYNQFIGFKESELNLRVPDVIEFLENEHTKNNDPAYIFAIGLLTLVFVDGDKGESILRKFSQMNIDGKYRSMRSRAESILRDLK